MKLEQETLDNIKSDLIHDYQFCYFSKDTPSTYNLPNSLRLIKRYGFVPKSIDNNISLKFNNDLLVLGENAFDFTSIFSDYPLINYIINDNLRAINDYAFEYNKKLTTISALGVKVMGRGAFFYCNSLKHVNLPEAEYVNLNPPSGITTLSLPKAKFIYFDNVGFYNLPSTSMVNYDFPEAENVNIISSSSATSVNLPKVKAIRCFNNCSSLTGTLELPELRYYESGGAYSGGFEGCNKLTGISLPKTRTIRMLAYSGLNITMLNIPEARVLYSEALKKCTKLPEIYLPKIIYISTRTFQYCTSLATVTFGPDLAYIDSTAFQYCTALATINVIGDENCTTAQTLQALDPSVYNNATIVYNYTPPSEDESENDSNDGE